MRCFMHSSGEHLPHGQVPPAIEASGMTFTLVMVFVLAMPLVNVLGPTVMLTPPSMAGAALIGWLALTGRFRLDSMYIVLLGICVICFVPWIWSAAYLSRATAVHAASILAAITIYYGGVRCGLEVVMRCYGPRPVLVVLYASLFGTSAFILFEVFATNWMGVDLNAWIPYVEVADFRAQVLGTYMRPRGLATEPGVMALFYDFSMFFVLPLLRQRGYRLGYFIVVLPGYLLLMSAASLLICGAVAAALVARGLWRRFCSTGLRLALVAGVIAAVAIRFWDALTVAGAEIIGGRLAAFVGGAAGASGTERVQRYQELAEVLTMRPFGIGFGVTPGLQDVGGLYEGIALAPGQISLFGAFAAAGGPLAALALAAALVWAYWRVARVPVFGVPIAAGGVAVSLHHVFVTEYWLPFFWFALAAAVALAASHRGVGTGVSSGGGRDVESGSLSHGVT